MNKKITNLQLRFFSSFQDEYDESIDAKFAFISPLPSSKPGIPRIQCILLKIGKLRTQKSLLRTTTTTTGSRSPVARDSIQPSLAADNGSRRAVSVANTCH